MKRSVELDDELAGEVDKTAELVGEKPATVIRMAVRAGLSTIRNRFQALRPPGYFKDDYAHPDKERLVLEEAMSKVPQHPER